ncbi:hypothetical protein C1G87_1434 [Dehalococcoides mccartyi]|uniref:Uncharacterized protein n=1 Tax=Dehalococcoides mccartyi TaxID=61435 RepID=A0A328EK40_9CHLR|nr:hypothetical protein C1G87_1434 [Dehalococcoides mccartyi]
MNFKTLANLLLNQHNFILIVGVGRDSFFTRSANIHSTLLYLC